MRTTDADKPVPLTESQWATVLDALADRRDACEEDPRTADAAREYGAVFDVIAAQVGDTVGRGGPNEVLGTERRTSSDRCPSVRPWGTPWLCDLDAGHEGGHIIHQKYHPDLTCWD